MRNPDDPIIAQARAATQRLLAEMRGLSPDNRAAFIVKELGGLDPMLPAKVNKTIVELIRKGYNANDAMFRAIEVEAANAMLNRFVNAGKAQLSGLGGFGGLGAVGKDVGNFALNLLGGAACSTALTDLIVNKVGTGSGRDAAAYATAGSDALRGAVRCGGAAAATPTAPPPPPPPPPAPPKMPIWPFVAGGVALLGVGVVFMATRKS